tara:strand:+ start:17819 stop:18190 length:372 start_codon:yes stop_codon:yes gene_type:complete
MATLIPKLTLKSEGSMTDALDISTLTNIRVISDPKEFGRIEITTSTNKTIMPTNSSYCYLYMKLQETTNTTDYITVSIGVTSDVRLRKGEFLFLPLINSKEVKAIAVGGTCKVEYGYWSRSTA